MNALFIGAQNSSKWWDTVCLVAALETQTEISNASGPRVAQTSSTFVWQPPGLRWRWFSALHNMFWKYLCCETRVRSNRCSLEEEHPHRRLTARISPVRLLPFKLGTTFGLFWCIAVFKEKWHFYLRLQRILNTDAWEKLLGQPLMLLMDGAEVNVMAWNCYYTQQGFFSRPALAHHFFLESADLEWFRLMNTSKYLGIINELLIPLPHKRSIQVGDQVLHILQELAANWDVLYHDPI